MTKVALINPGKNQSFAITEPTSLGFIAGYLQKNGIEVIIIDELAGDDVKKQLSHYRPDIVGITATTPVAPDAYRVADICRRRGILTVMGGVHASVLPEEALRHVDVVVRGEGEVAMLDIARNGISSSIMSRDYIKNLDDVPILPRHLMKMDFYLGARDRVGGYLHFIPPHTRVASLMTSRGCPYSCTFCHNSWRDAPYRFTSPERVVEEIGNLTTTYDVGAVFFIEDNLFVNRRRIRRICELIIDSGFNIIWGGNARVDNIDLETLELAKKAGCHQITFGFESGSQRILDALNKRTTVEQAREAVSLCRRAGILAQGTFMIGNPGETVEDIRLTQQFIRENDIYHPGVCITTPFPGTELWTWCKDRGLIPNSLTWSDFTYQKVPIFACETIAPGEFRRLYSETMAISQERVPIVISEMVRSGLWRPAPFARLAAQVIRNLPAIPGLVRRLRFKSEDTSHLS